jgi:threonine synthase
MTVMVSYLNDRRINSVVEDSSGNGGAALAAYAAAAKMKCRVLMPASTSPSKVFQIVACGAEAVLIHGTRQEVSETALVEAEKCFYASHNWQPLFVEGVKTLGYELWENLGFSVPDNIVMPVGGGSSLLGCWRAFCELKQRGEVDHLPRLFGVQAANCAPLHHAFVAGHAAPRPLTILPTIAEGIAIAKPIRVREILRAMISSGGGSVAVSETEIVAALKELSHRGLLVEPTSAAAAAGLTRLIANRTIGENETTVLVLSGSGLKAIDKIGRLLDRQ